MTEPTAQAVEALKKLRRGCVECHTVEDLKRKLASGRRLRVKLGVDPTSPDLHLGHTVVFNRLRAFQDLGHTAVLIIGDFTARIGDPSGRDATRPALSPEEIEKNAETYKDQAFRVLDPARTELRRNSEWLEPFVRTEMFPVLKRCTVSQLLQREDFAARMGKGLPITLLEILYPIFQGYDSVAVKADVELGGTDQLFNLLMGRGLQKDLGQEPQVAMTFPLLLGTDGVRKMSKSYGNAISLNEPAREMFGKLMRVSDELMRSYYELLTDEDPSRVEALHPMEAKKALAETITARYHGVEAARAERGWFESTFSRRQTPSDASTVNMPSEARSGFWSAYLVSLGACKSRKEAQRKIAQGAVRVNGEKLKDELIDQFLARRSQETELSLKVGSHKFYKLRFDK